jgi:hypothetical protein
MVAAGPSPSDDFRHLDASLGLSQKLMVVEVLSKADAFHSMNVDPYNPD